jgi:hypothetical protein
MKIREKALRIDLQLAQESILAHLTEEVESKLHKDEIPIRFVVSKTDKKGYHCEVASISEMGYHPQMPPSIFRFRERQYENNEQFNAVMVIPTGINCEIGGHAGDATPVARLLASLCDNLIIHPNVVNASDINELTENCLMVEGSILSRLLMGTVGLQTVRSNRVLVIIESLDSPEITEAAINSVSAARATLGLNVTGVVCMKKPAEAEIEFADSGRATGHIVGMEKLLDVLLERRDSYDALAIITALNGTGGKSQEALMYDYYMRGGTNPWGGIEALLTHSLSSFLDKPTIHAPIMESDAPLNFGLVDPRKAAEVVSRTFMHCVMKGVHRSPKIITNRLLFGKAGVLSVEDIHCLIIPEGALGLPTLAALEQGIPVIAVHENHNLMENNLSHLPFAEGKYFLVDNYLEAAGLMAAMKAGTCPSALRRPIPDTKVSEFSPYIETEFVW